VGEVRLHLKKERLQREKGLSQMKKVRYRLWAARLTPLRYGQVPSDSVCQAPFRQIAGPTLPETATQPLPALLDPADASLAGEAPPSVGDPEPASHEPEHMIPYWHDVPSGSVHADPFCGCDVGQPLSAMPLSPQSPP
jgi:hypothetical protein